MSKANEEFESQKQELRAEFVKFRDKASYLVNRISAHFPSLTQHDITHLDALWETAEIIIGPDYPLNPLEAFILGGAFLLHDSSICFEAYEKGKEGIRETDTWKDIYADLKEKNYDEHIDDEADFHTLRYLHAEQATLLVDKHWKDPETGDQIFLIDNYELRKHVGSLIGKIASSHHWDIERIERELKGQFNAPAGFARDWRINPIKLACILRCADAAHISNDRAPDFLHALIKRSGLSLTHWQAQNKLAPVDLDQLDPTDSTLLFTSTRHFKEDDSEAWWLTYDAIRMVDKEIRSSNALLSSVGVKMPEFRIKRVKGIESPELMLENIKVEGWSPCNAELHVSNIEKLIKELGGHSLYGFNEDSLFIGLRELVQNGRDAIKARQIFDEEFEGKIRITIKRVKDSIQISIDDNGVGMSPRVLTGPLLDFGTSFWTSSLVRSEFPGLRSSKFKSIGKFGVGFYSIFMIAEEVYVSSRPYKEGLRNVNQLSFKKGLSLRPLMKNEIPTDFSPALSTQIKFLFKSKLLSDDLKYILTGDILNAPDKDVLLHEYIAFLCVGLDVDVTLKINNENEYIVHESIDSPNFNVEKWIKDITFFHSNPNGILEKIIKEYSSNIRPIKGDIYYGYGALNPYFFVGANLVGVSTVGGLPSEIFTGHSFVDYILGYVDTNAESAKRDGDILSAPQKILDAWIDEQIQLINYESLENKTKYYLTNVLCDLKYDYTKIGLFEVHRNNKLEYLNFKDLINLIEKENISFFKKKYKNIEYLVSNIKTYFVEGFNILKGFHSGYLLSSDLSKSDDSHANSLLNNIVKYITPQKKRIQMEKVVYNNNLPEDNQTYLIVITIVDNE